MKLKILSVDCPISGKGIDTSSFYESPSFTDYDVLIIDPQIISDSWLEKITPHSDGSLVTYSNSDGGYSKSLREIMGRRAQETKLLLENTGGIVICFLRDKGIVLNWASSLSEQKHEVSMYSWIPSTFQRDKYILSPYFHPITRFGREIGQVNKNHAFFQYFMALKENIYFEAVIGDADLLECSQPIASNKVGEIISLEVLHGNGKFIFLPPFDKTKDIDKVSGILIDCIRKSLQWTTPLVKPDWLGKYSLTGEEDLLKESKAVDSEIKRLSTDRERIVQEIYKLECLKGILYETGKYALEPSVREAFRVIGFDVKEPEEYYKPYDLFAIEDNIFVIGEIEGSRNQIGVEKYRQLLDYVMEATLEGNKCKGILIGNGFVDTEPLSREEQFTEQAIRGCNSQKYCRMSTFELYKAVSAVLSCPKNQELKNLIKEKIMSCGEEFKFDIKLEKV